MPFYLRLKENEMFSKSYYHCKHAEIACEYTWPLDFVKTKPNQNLIKLKTKLN